MRVMFLAFLAVWCGWLYADEPDVFGFLNPTNYTAKSEGALSCGEVGKQLIDLGGKIIKVKAMQKRDITPVAESVYLATVYYNMECLMVLFHKDGYNYINAIPNMYWYNRSHYFFVYVPDQGTRKQIKDAASKLNQAPYELRHGEGVAIAIGRSERSGLRNTSVYGW